MAEAAYNLDEDQLPVGDLLTARKYPGDGNAWKGVVHTSAGQVEVMVKLLDARGVFIECLAGLVGRNMGLPIPQPYIVRINPASLREANLPGPTIAFGCSLLRAPNLARSTRSREDVRLALHGWALLRGAIAFDELIANTDRNPSNVLLRGKNIHLIDHDHAMRSPLDPAMHVRNELLAIATEELHSFELRRVEQQFRTYDFTRCEIAVSCASSSNNLALLSQDCKGDHIYQFLLERTQHLKSLILQGLQELAKSRGEL